LTEDDALLNVKWLAEHGGVDFVEISGGNYENPCKSPLVIAPCPYGSVLTCFLSYSDSLCDGGFRLGSRES
jgi:hypothetical protein